MGQWFVLEVVRGVVLRGVLGVVHGVVIGVVHNRGVLGVVLIICMKRPLGEFSFVFANFCEFGDSDKSSKSGDFKKMINRRCL